MTEYIRTGSKKGRGMAQASLDMIDTMHDIIEALQPLTGRGVGYQLFNRKLTPSMSKGDMAAVYRLLRIARERGDIPWAWIVDEGRKLEGRTGWSDPEQFARIVESDYRRNFWDYQPLRVQVWSEKGTVRGLLRPVTDKYGVQFQPVGGFGSSTKVHDAAIDYDGRPLKVLYVGDVDPSGMHMSERDLPGRFAEYGGDHIEVKRIALTFDQLREYFRTGSNIPEPFPAKDKKDDTRYPWYVENYGDTCWELDAMNPNDLRDCVDKAIYGLIEHDAWNRCELCNQAEQGSLKGIMSAWARSNKKLARQYGLE